MNLNFCFKYSKNDFSKVTGIAEDFFRTEEEDEQMPGNELDLDFCYIKFPLTLSIIKFDNKIICYSYILSCNEENKKLFLSKKINNY